VLFKNLQKASAILGKMDDVKAAIEKLVGSRLFVLAFVVHQPDAV
jgi:hypothetical protein